MHFKENSHGAIRILADWTAVLQKLLPHLHGHRVKALAQMSLAMSLTGRCQLSRLDLLSHAKPTSTERRWQRLMANKALPVPELCRQVGRQMLGQWGQRRMLLLLDETGLGNRLRCLKISVAFRRRALPLDWICYKPDALPASQPQLVARLLRRLAPMLPPQADVVLLADRGLAWPLLIDLCQELGWHFVLRVQGQSHVLLPDGTHRAIQELADQPGQQWMGRGGIFHVAGWRKVNIVTLWESQQDQPWLLVTDLEPTRQRCRDYGKRTGQEESFRDDKSHGLNWQDSRIWIPEHAERLLLVMALAMWLTIAVGVQVVKRAWRRRIDRASRRTLSIFQLGHRWLERCLYSSRAPPCNLHLYPS